jgi:hypothetical protein
MEPCLLCFGAIAMGSIRHVKYAARDSFAGATSINELYSYSKSKNIKIEGPINELEYFQIFLHSYWFLKNNQFLKNHPNREKMLIEHAKDCERGVEIARSLYKIGKLEKFCIENRNIEYVYNEIMKLFT